MASNNIYAPSTLYYITTECGNLAFPPSPTEGILPSNLDMIFQESQTNVPTLELLIQPIQKHRFRYQSESGSHGGIAGEGCSQGKKKKFPTVMLQNHDIHFNKNVLIKASLYTCDDNPRPHVLGLAGKTCENGVCYQKLDSKNCATFQGISIVNKTRYDVLEILRERKKSELNILSLNESQLEETQEEAKKLNLNAVKLCFEVVFEDNKNLVPGVTKILSNTILNLKSPLTGDLRICRLSMWKGKSTGDEEMILLCNKIKKEEIEIRFFEKDDLDNILWSATAHFNPVDVHHQVAIPFRTPKYVGDSLREGNEVVVWIQLVRKTDEAHGEPVQFTYKCNENKNSKKRKIASFEDFPVQSQSLQMDSDILTNFGSLDPQDLNPRPLFDGVNALKYPIDLLENLDFLNTDSINPSCQDVVNTDAVEVLQSPNPFPMDKAAVSKMRVMNQCELIEKQLNDMSLSEVKMTQETEQTSNEKFSLGIKNLLKHKNILYYSSEAATIQDTNGNSLLHLAIMDKKSDMIYGALKFIKEDLVNHKNLRDETPVHLAIYGNHVKVLKLLLHHGGNPYHANGDGNNCFHLASINNFSECMEVLLSSAFADKEKKYSVDINSLNFDGLAPIHLSVIHNSKECMKLLLNAKADINVIEKKSGKSPLHLAVELSPSLAIDLLSQPDIDVDREDYGGFTALQNACERHKFPYESLSFEMTCDKQQIASLLMKFFKEDNESDSSYHSASESITESEDEDEEFEENVENFLNTNMNWKKLGSLVEMDEKSLEILGKLDKNPAKRLIKMIKVSILNTKGGVEEILSKKTLLYILQMAGFSDEVKHLLA